MGEIDCDRPSSFRNKLDAESCARVLEKKTGKPHRANGILRETEDINWWHTVHFYDCFDGTIFTRDKDISTRELARQCATSLNRIETGGKSYKAVLHKKTGWFDDDHYKVVGTQPHK